MKLAFRMMLAAVLLTGSALAGNGAPSGAHYNLNLLGKFDCTPNALTGSNRHTIQVLLEYEDQDGGYWTYDAEGNPVWNPLLAVDLDRRNKIFLQEGDEFQVLDGNACDGALFQLPANPYTCPENDPECLNTSPTFQGYEVFVREGGKPGGYGDMKTCATAEGEDGLLDTPDDEIVCSTENVVLVRDSNRKFENVTKQLTTMCLDLDGIVEANPCDARYGIFDEEFQDYFWDFDNHGLRLVQLRFYPIADAD
jgi:hypothetical protein